MNKNAIENRQQRLEEGCWSLENIRDNVALVKQLCPELPPALTKYLDEITTWSKSLRDKLVLNNRGLVGIAIKRTRSKLLAGGIPIDDVMQDGFGGLVIAADRFDARRGLRFSTYATWWIFQSINRSRLADMLIHIPAYVFERDCGKETLQQREAILSRRKVSLTRLQKVEDANEADVLADCSFSTTNAVNLLSDRVQIEELLRHARQPEQELLRLYYLEEKTLEEIGRIIGVTKERVRQKLAAALGRIQRWLVHEKRLPPNFQVSAPLKKAKRKAL